MKNLMMAVVMLITCTTSMAQGIQEPEYIGQVPGFRVPCLLYR